MRIAVLADVHGNLEALTAVLEDLGAQAPERVLFLGDAVGYGPDPNACVEKIFEVADTAVAGNHDHGALELISTAYFNPFAQAAIRWTQTVLTKENRERLLSMPMTAREGDLLLVHATPERPEAWHYLLYDGEARRQFEFFDEKACLYGHTHRPIGFVGDGNNVRRATESLLTFQEQFRYIVNVGSVGQPRDSNPDAAYCLYDTREKVLSFQRVPYNYRITQEKMRAAGLPAFLIERLQRGV